MKIIKKYRLSKFGIFQPALLVFILSTLYSLQPTASIAQITFERTYGGTSFDSGNSVQKTSDGGFILLGYTGSFGAGSNDVYLIKTDSLGDTLWTKTYGDASPDFGFSVQETQDGGYILAGQTSSFGAGGNDFYLIKTDTIGDTLWTYTYGGTSNDQGYSVQETQGGGYILAGYTGSFGAGSNDVYLVKTDSIGDTLWTRTFGGVNSDGVSSVRQTSDGGYILAGSTSSFGAGSSDVYLIRTDTLGIALWTKTFGGVNSDGGYSVQQTLPDAGFIIVGETSSFGAGGNDVFLIKTDSIGDTLWTRTFGGVNSDGGYSVQSASDGGFILTGYTTSFGAGGNDVYLIKTDSSGNSLWTKTYGGISNDLGFSIQKNPDGSFIIGGYTESFGAGSYDAYLIKTPLEIDGGMVSISSPQDTVFTDSTYSVSATVHNFGLAPLSFDAIATIDGYTDTVSVVNLSSGSDSLLNFASWTVPSTDSFSYSMIVCTEVYGDSIPTNDCIQKSIYAYNPVGVEEENSAFSIQYSAFRLYQNHPNPFHNSTLIRYQIPQTPFIKGGLDSGHFQSYKEVSLNVYDITGRLVETLVQKKVEPGIYQLPISSHQLPGSGIFFYRLQIGDEFRQARKMILLK